MTAARKPFLSSVLELVLVVVSALVLALAIQAFIVKPYRIPSGSMLPTLQINQRVLVNRIGSDFSSPQLGDIVVFHPPKAYADGCLNPNEGQVGPSHERPCDAQRTVRSSETFIKRVVGLPGDRISIRNGHVIRNGAPEKDAYIERCNGEMSCSFPGTITIPRGDYFMMGDNRPDSEDSRYWGPVPRSWIIGKAFFTYWPPDRIGFL